MIEQANAYNLYDFDKGNADPANQLVVSQQLPFYLCPTAPMRRLVPSCEQDAGRAPGNYAACIGSADFNQYWSFYMLPRPELDGAIVYTDSKPGTTRIRDFVDGTTNTLLIGETAYNLPDYVFSATSPPDCAGQSRYSFTYWSNPYPGSTGNTTAYDFNPRDVAGDSIFDANWTRSFRSDHTGGVQFSLADGSVHFISENIDAGILDALATRAGGEVVGEF